jgi:hypothetical protein
MSKHGFGLLDLDEGSSWRRPDGTAVRKPSKASTKEEASVRATVSEGFMACERLLLKRLWWLVIALGVAIVLNVWAVKLGRGSHVHISLVLQAIGLVGLPVFVISLVLMCVGRDKWPLVFIAGYAMNLVSLVIFLMLISACIGLFVATADTRAAMSYCEALIPRVEKYKQDTGKYPDTIEAVASREHEPLLLQGRQFYIAMPDGYVLEFKRPQKTWETIEYTSWTGKWKTRR